MVYYYWPHKAEKHQDHLSYPDILSTTEVKSLLDSTISSKGIWFATCDIKYFYLNTLMARYKYVHIHQHHDCAKIQQQRKMHQQFDTSGYVYFEAQKGMYGLKQAG